MSYCIYTKKNIDSFGTTWNTLCKHSIYCEAPMEVGFSFAPLPTEGNHKYCSFCGKEIKLKE